MSFAYVALVHKPDVEHSAYIVKFPDFPEQQYDGSSMEEALEIAKHGLIIHVQARLDENKTLPDPTPLDDVISKKENLQASAALIKISIPLDG
jgi:predicted RNase H-like HicB family nuclease